MSLSQVRVIHSAWSCQEAEDVKANEVVLCPARSSLCKKPTSLFCLLFLFSLSYLSLQFLKSLSCFLACLLICLSIIYHLSIDLSSVYERCTYNHTCRGFFSLAFYTTQYVCYISNINAHLRALQ